MNLLFALMVLAIVALTSIATSPKRDVTLVIALHREHRQQRRASFAECKNSIYGSMS
jgi:hypothetical protein